MRSKCANCLKIHETLVAQCAGCGGRRLVTMPVKRATPTPRRPPPSADPPADAEPNRFYLLPLVGGPQ